MKDYIKENSEQHLLLSMKSIDCVIRNINENTEKGDDFDTAISKLLNAKNEVKRVLNKHFDECARRK